MPFITDRYHDQNRQRRAASSDAASQDAVGRDAVGRDAVGRDAVGRDAVGRDAVGRDAVGRDAVGRDAVGRDAVGRDAVGRDAVGRDAVGPGAAGQDTAGRDAVGPDTVGPGAAGQDTAGQDTASQDTAGRDAVSPDDASRDAASPEAVSPEPGGPPPGFTAEGLAERLRGRVLGQDPAIEAVVRAIVLARAGATEPDRPPATMLLLGPTGVGKTELVRQVAAALRSGPDDLCRVDMNSLAQEHYAASFNGAPPGYAGSKEAFTVFDRSTVEGDPYTPGIVLFDEVEKAHPTVLRALLGVLDHGVLRLANGQQKISFRNCFVFLTSNLGSAELARRRGSRWRALLDRAGSGGLSAHTRRAVVNQALQGFFDPEFLNRVDETVVFDELDRGTVERVARLETDLLRARLRRRGVDLQVDESAVRLVAVEGFDPVYGARGLRRTLRTLLAAPVAEELMRVRPVGTGPVRITATAAPGGLVNVQAG